MENEVENTQKRDQQPKDHFCRFAGNAVAAATAIRLAWPGLSSEQIAADLAGKVTAGAVRQWRSGIRPVPPWVRDLIRARAQAAIAAVDRIPPGKGKDAGARALAAWRAARNLQR